MNETPLRKCSRCGREFPETPEFFHRFKLGRNGLKSECKECACKRIKEYNATHPEAAKRSRQKAYYSKRDQILEQKKQYYWDKREEKLEYQTQYYEENKDACLSYRRKHYQENREAALANKAEYNRTHRIERRALENKRRARKKNNGGTHTAADIQAQYNKQDGLCYYCGCEVGDQYHVDHFVPLALGGGNGPENIVISCPKCNCSKQDSHPHDFIARLAS